MHHDAEVQGGRRRRRSRRVGGIPAPRPWTRPSAAPGGAIPRRFRTRRGVVGGNGFQQQPRNDLGTWSCETPSLANCGRSTRIDQAARRVAEAAIAAGARLSAIADAEREGELRARQELGADVLRHVTRAAKRKRSRQRIRTGPSAAPPARTLSHREIAAAASVSHGTVRAILTRGSTISDNGKPAEAQPLGSEPGEIAA
jgi:hypothetical protein